MNVKPHIYILVFILTFLGVVSQQQESFVNQELVLHFADVKVSSQEAKNAIASVKQELELLGIDNIQVKSEYEGKLTIAYYSDVDVASLKKILSEKKSLKLQYPLDNQQLPVDNQKVGYDFDIYEIDNGHELDSGFNNCIIVEKASNDRYIDPNTCFATQAIKLVNHDALNQTYHIWKTIESSISNLPYCFPEVRAGPAA